MRRLLVLLLLVIGPIPLAASPAWACSCSGEGGLETAVLAFDGTVRDVESDGQTERVRFAVDRLVKGSAMGEVTLTTWASEPSCGYRFDEGGRYRVYATDGVTSLCSGNESLTPSASPVVRAQRQAAEDRSTIFWMGTGAVALLVAAGLTLLLRHPKPGD